MEDQEILVDQGFEEAVYGCAEMWRAAIRCYAIDVRQAVSRRNPGLDAQRALADLLGDRVQLGRLCAHLDYEADWLADLLLEDLTRPDYK